MIQFYKPNPRVTGSACSFWFNERDNCFFACILKQDSWNAEKRIGSFSANKDNPEKKVTLKLAGHEVAGILNVIDAKTQKFEAYHSSEKATTIFKFEPYMRDNVQVGYSFGANRTEKEDTTKKHSFLIGLTFDEGRLLKEYLTFALSEQFIANKAQRLAKYAGRAASSAAPMEPVTESAPAASDSF